MLEQLLTVQYQQWHTLTIDTLRQDVEWGCIDADAYKRITGEDYVQETVKE